MEARAELVVHVDERGRTRPTTMFGEAPLLLRVTDRGDRDDVGALNVHLVGGAAGPLGGDRLATTVDVGRDAQLRVRSVAASLAQPGALSGSVSEARVAANIGPGAMLDWHPQPLISVAGSHHVQHTTLALADETSTVRWVDEVVLGRHGEPGGQLTMHQRFTVAGRPVLHHTLRFGPDRFGDELGRIGRHGQFRVAVTAVVLGVEPPASEPAVIIDTRRRLCRLKLDTSHTMWTALADDLDDAHSGLAELGLGAMGGCGLRNRHMDTVDV
jgi:urease accessory protein